MSKTTKSTDTAYLLTFRRYDDSDTALVIAPNPIQARNKLVESLRDYEKWGLDEDSIEVSGELRDRVKAAEENGVSIL